MWFLIAHQKATIKKTHFEGIKLISDFITKKYKINLFQATIINNILILQYSLQSDHYRVILEEQTIQALTHRCIDILFVF